MHIVDVRPDQGSYEPGEPVALHVGVHCAHAEVITIAVAISHLDTVETRLTRQLQLRPGDQDVAFVWTPPAPHARGFGVEVALCSADGRVLHSRSGAFDVLAHWTAFPRYGFLTDFSPGRTDAEATIQALTRYHINGLQFYDWQYRHDSLVAPTAEYLDPLGRQLSLDTIAAFIAAAHAHGMAAMPYLAVYAASVAYWRAHAPDALYDSEGRPLVFGEDFLGLMNPASGGGWAQHLLGECMRTVQALPFDGLHVDQYGEPKVAFDATGQPVDLPAAFVAFINALKQARPGATVLFNAVGNWPSATLATSAQDFAYIEVWPPCVTYRELGQVVSDARLASGGKPVVIALYLPPERMSNMRLADAWIYSHGGTRIEFGEQERLLTDPYFPKHQPMGHALSAVLRRYSDFAVRYGELIGPAAEDIPELRIEAPAGVEGVARRGRGGLRSRWSTFRS